MKVECDKEKLKWALATADRVTGKNLTLPALSQVFLEAQNHSLKIRATNLDLGIEILLPVKLEEGGLVLVNGGVLSNLLSNLTKDKTVKLEIVNKNLVISSDRASSLIKTYPSDDFPPLPRIAAPPQVVMPSELLVDGLKTVSYAAALSDIKPEISSVYFYGDNNQVFFAATDSFRLSEKKNIWEGNSGDLNFKLIIPVKNVFEIIRIFDGVPDQIEVGFDQHQLFLRGGGVYLVSRLIDGVFPDYRQIIPASNKTSVAVSRDDFQSALKLSGVFSDRFNQINLRIIAADNIFEINSLNADIGENTVRLETVSLQGEDVDVSVNLKYLLDCLSSIQTGNINLNFNGPGKPLMISGAGDNSFLGLIMPLNR